MVVLLCPRCRREFPLFPPKYMCHGCGGLLEYSYNYEEMKENLFLEGPISQWRYKVVFPWVDESKIISLGEGGTPLQRSNRLAGKIGAKNIYFKDETRNPTFSFRDRCASLLVSNALQLSYDSVVCASNGNLGASVSAYSSKAGLECHVIVPLEVDEGKLAQMMVYDADIVQGGRTLEEAVENAEKMEKENNWYQATADLNPLVIEAQKVISYEIFEQGVTPDLIVVPTGSGGTAYSLWKGFKELRKLGFIDETPKVVCVQPEDCSPIVDAYVKGLNVVEEAIKPRTVALAVLVSKPIYGEKALQAIRESGGVAVSVSDYEILRAQKNLATLEGLFVEPASASTVAAVMKMVKEDEIDRGDKIICLLTGSGLKAPSIIDEFSKRRRLKGFETKVGMKEEILMLIKKEPVYGYKLWKMLQGKITLQAVYQHLNQMKRKGFLTSYTQNGRRYFKITSKGMKALKALEELRGI